VIAPTVGEGLRCHRLAGVISVLIDRSGRHMQRLADTRFHHRPADRRSHPRLLTRAFCARTASAMRIFSVSLCLFLPFFSAAPPNPPANPLAPPKSPATPQLRDETVAAFDRYVRLTNERNDAELRSEGAPLWVDRLAEAPRREAYDALKRGEVQIEQLKTLDGGQPIRCPGGLIHHWVAAAFLPGARLDDVLAILQDYDHQSTYYAPDVERSKIESRDGDHFRVFLRFRRHKVITVVLDTEHGINYFHDGPGRAHSRSSAVRIAEVENPGTDHEREKPPGDDGGFLWRMETWWRMREADGGVYVQSEVVSLTRDIPTGLGWMIGPFVTSIPKETLLFTMEATRTAVEKRRPPSASAPASLPLPARPVSLRMAFGSGSLVAISPLSPPATPAGS
jgi:hypothetical protein